MNNWITSIYNNKNIEKYCRALVGDEWAELRSEMIEQILKWDDSKIKKAVEGNYIEYVCFTICKRIKVGNIKDTGIFWNKAKFADGELMDIPDTTPETDENYEKIMERVEGLHWYHKILFKHYYVDGMNLREISEMYNIHLQSVNYAIKKALSQIKKQLGR